MDKTWELFLIDARAELLCALCQMTEKDDKIIAGHVRKAADLLHKMILNGVKKMMDRIFDYIESEAFDRVLVRCFYAAVIFLVADVWMNIK